MFDRLYLGKTRKLRHFWQNLRIDDVLLIYFEQYIIFFLFLGHRSSKSTFGANNSMGKKLLNFISAHFTSFALQSKLDQGHHKGAFWPGDAVLLAGHHLLEDALQVPVGDVEARLDQGLDWRW